MDSSTGKTMKRSSPALRLIAGDLDQAFTINGVTMRLSPQERRLPSAVEALVVEQDTSLLLDESLQLEDEQQALLESESAASLSEALFELEISYPIGGVYLKGRQPKQIMVVIHDLNQSPSWSEAGIKEALSTLFTQLTRYRVRSLAIPALAYRYGPLPVQQFLTLLCEQLKEQRPTWDGELWLLVPRHTLQPSLETLHSLCDIHQP
jgi:hypothetical protein